METKKQYVVYTIEYQGRVIYVGSTDNFERRKKEHLSGRGAIPDDVDTDMVTIQVVKVWKSRKAMLNSEDRLIRKYDTINNGWNKNRSSLSKEELKAYQKAYQVEWNRKNRYGKKEWLEHRKASARKYYETHKEYYREYQRQWYEKNRKKKAE